MTCSTDNQKLSAAEIVLAEPVHHLIVGNDLPKKIIPMGMHSVGVTHKKEVKMDCRQSAQGLTGY